MVFFLLAGLALLLGLMGKPADRRTYTLIAIAGLAGSLWFYHSA